MFSVMLLSALLQLTNEYPVGTVLEYTATPSPGWEFAGWEGGVESLNNPLVVTLSATAPAITIVATFEQPPPSDTVSVTVEQRGEGVVSYRMLSLPGCGDGTVNPPWETCDDGNAIDGDGCSAICQSEPPPSPAECGNGIVELPEQCEIADLVGETCESRGFAGGTLTCNECAFDTSACTTTPTELSLIDHGATSQSGSTTFRRTLVQPPEAGSTLAVLAVTAPTAEFVSVMDEGGAYTKAVEAISDDTTQWSVGRAAIFYRFGVQSQPWTVTVVTSMAAHVRFTVVEIRGGVSLGATSGAFGSTGTPNAGVITTTQPAVVLSLVHTVGGMPISGQGNILLNVGSASWYSAAQYRIETQPGTYSVDFVAGSNRWVSAAAAFEALQ